MTVDSYCNSALLFLELIASRAGVDLLAYLRRFPHHRSGRLRMSIVELSTACTYNGISRLDVRFQEACNTAPDGTSARAVVSQESEHNASFEILLALECRSVDSIEQRRAAMPLHALSYNLPVPLDLRSHILHNASILHPPLGLVLASLLAPRLRERALGILVR